MGVGVKLIGLKNLAKKKYLIIGNGAAGISAAEAIRSVDKDIHITVISEEPCPAYSKVLLHNYIGGEVDEGVLFSRPERFYTDFQIEPLFGVKVNKIFPDERMIRLANGSELKFDKLLLATGSSPWKPNIKGIDQRGIYTLWTIDDARRIRSSLRGCRNVIVMGGSFVGMQALHSLLEYGLKITVVDIADHIMPRSLDSESSRIVQRYLEEKGVKFLLGFRPVEIQHFASTKRVLILEDGRSVPGDIIIVTTGAKPNIGLTEGSSIERNGGLLVDESMRTNYPGIFAAGDIAEVFDCLTGTRKIFGLWTTAVEQGKIAGLNMAGKNVAYPGGMDMNTIEVLGLPIITIGKTAIKRDFDQWKEEVFVHPRKRVYRKFLFEKDRLVGAILIGHVEDAGMVGNLIRSRRKIDHGECHFCLGFSSPRRTYLPYAGGYEFQSI